MRPTDPEIPPREGPAALLPPPPGTEPEPPKPPPPTNEPPQAPQPDTSPGPHRIWPWIVPVLLLAVLAWFFWPHQTATQVPGRPVGASRGRGPAVTPVVAVHARKGNIGVYVTGLGAVTPISTVTIRSRVDGQLINVYFKEGDRVQQGEALIEIDPRPYQAAVIQAEGQLARDQAELANAIIDVSRYTVLLAQNAIPEQQLTTQKALVKQLEGTVRNDQGLLDAARVNLAYTHITAPITGIVGLRLVDPGNIVHASDTNGLLVITQIEPISVIFTVSEDQLQPIVAKMRAGARLQVDAYGREMKNKLASGYLGAIDNQIDQTTGTVKLRAVFPNENGLLFPNQFVNARLLLQEKTGVTLLPSAAIQRNAQNTYVWLIRPDNTVTLRNVVVGTTDGTISEINSGLSPGDLVVMTGVDKLEEGSKVIPHVSGAP